MASQWLDPAGQGLCSLSRNYDVLHTLFGLAPCAENIPAITTTFPYSYSAQLLSVPIAALLEVVRNNNSAASYEGWRQLGLSLIIGTSIVSSPLNTATRGCVLSRPAGRGSASASPSDPRPILDVGITPTAETLAAASSRPEPAHDTMVGEVGLCDWRASFARDMVQISSIIQHQ